MLDDLPAASPQNVAAADTAVAIRLRDMHAGALRGPSSDIPTGSITGVTGLVGSGAEELLEVTAGVTRPQAGTVEIGGTLVRLRSSADALSVGVGYVAGSRAAAGLAELTVRENVLLSKRSSASRDGFVLRGPERREAARHVAALGLDHRLEDRLGTLSGGNQQKAIVARLLAAGVTVLVLNDPTAGVDARALQEVHRLLRSAAQAGNAVLVRCSEPEELLDLADTIYVLAGGLVVRSATAGNVNLAELLQASASSGRETSTKDTYPGTAGV